MIRIAFANAKAVGRYFGLVPRQDQSGDKNRLGHITREGAPVVRQLVAEAAWQALRRSPTVRAYFERAQRDDPQRKKIALVATAHYLVRVMWAMLKRGTFGRRIWPWPGSRSRLARTMINKQIEIERFHVKIESGTQVASRGPTWRIATPPV